VIEVAVLDPPTAGTVVPCRRCGRPLRAWVSRARRIGPCCLAFEARVFRAQAQEVSR
jgi:hypothetical protein